MEFNPYFGFMIEPSINCIVLSDPPHFLYTHRFALPLWMIWRISNVMWWWLHLLMSFYLMGEGEGPAPPEEGQPGLPLGADREEREAYLQKRMVDFVKRRVLVLEKVLNAEYHCMVCPTASTVNCQNHCAVCRRNLCTMLENAFPYL